MKNTRFLIASGGTGGHFYPGFALGKALRAQGAEILFVVRRNDPAAKVLAANGLSFQEIDLTGLPRSINPMRHVRFVGKLIKSLRQTRQIIQTFTPQVTLGMGGYVSFPLIFCSHYKGIKTAVHESNAIWGLSNKICAYFADLPLLGLPMAHTFKKAVLTSTPVRPEFAQTVNKKEILEKWGLTASSPVVLIMGGSQGARGLNEALPELIKNNPSWQFIHVTGTRWYEEQQRKYTGLTNVKAVPYCEEIYQLMKAADLMICRSGASTLAEIMACKVPAIFVPFPHAAANHQYYNAKVLADGGCAQIILENSQLADALQHTLSHLGPDTLTHMRASYRRLHLPSPLEATTYIMQLLTAL